MYKRQVASARVTAYPSDFDHCGLCCFPPFVSDSSSSSKMTFDGLNLTALPTAVQSALSGCAREAAILVDEYLGLCGLGVSLGGF